MKRTSRRSFGTQLAVAIATLSVIAFGNTSLGQQTASQRKPSPDCQRKEHDTPPPTMLVSGSWIFEASTEKDHDWSTTTETTVGEQKAFNHYVPAYDRCGAAATADIYIAHVKIVDGSGEMLYHLDNDKKEEIKVKTFMSAGKEEFVSLTTEKKNFVLTFFENRELKKEEPSESDKSKNRQRALYKDKGGNDGKIYGIEVSKDIYTVYGVKLDGHPAAQELRIMIWWEAK
jgi:hypothetical protein